MRRYAHATVFGLLSSAAIAIAQPRSVIAPAGVVHGASHTAAVLPGQGVAPGSIFVLRGAGLGPETLVQAAPPYPPRLPEDPGGTIVTVRSLETGFTIDAWVVYSWAWQVAAILPSTIPPGPAEVVVAYQGQVSVPSRFQVVPAAPGVFTLSMGGFGPGVIQNYVSPAEQPLNQLARPALPGQVVILWATGLGAISGPDNSDPPVGTIRPNLLVEIDDRLIEPNYAGRAPGHPGVDQINVRLPDTLPDDCYTRLRLHAGRYASREVSIATANAPGPCRHPLSLSPETLVRVDGGGRAAIAEARLATTRILDEAGRTEFDSGFAGAQFVSVDAANLYALSAGRELPAPGCYVQPVGISGFLLGDEQYAPPPSPPSPFTPLDAGVALLLNGPGGQVEPLTRVPGGESLGWYATASGVPGAFFVAGTWSLDALGSAAVGPFRASLLLPPPIAPELPPDIDRAVPLVIRWRTDGFTFGDVVSVTLNSPVPVEQDPRVQAVASIACYAPAIEGRLFIPEGLLATLPSGSGQIGVTASPQAPAAFSAGGVDAASISYSRSVWKPVTLR